MKKRRENGCDQNENDCEWGKLDQRSFYHIISSPKKRFFLLYQILKDLSTKNVFCPGKRRARYDFCKQKAPNAFAFGGECRPKVRKSLDCANSLATFLLQKEAQEKSYQKRTPIRGFRPLRRATNARALDRRHLLKKVDENLHQTGETRLFCLQSEQCLPSTSVDGRHCCI